MGAGCHHLAAGDHADGDGGLVTADPGVAGRVFREEGRDAVALRSPVGEGAPPVVAELDLVLVEPDIVAWRFQVGLEEAPASSECGGLQPEVEYQTKSLNVVVQLFK